MDVNPQQVFVTVVAQKHSKRYPRYLSKYEGVCLFDYGLPKSRSRLLEKLGFITSFRE